MFSANVTFKGKPAVRVDYRENLQPDVQVQLHVDQVLVLMDDILADGDLGDLVLREALLRLSADIVKSIARYDED